MKRKIVKLVSLLAMLILSVFGMISCDPAEYKRLQVTANATKGENTLVIQVEEVENSDLATLMNVMLKLEEQKQFAFSTDPTGMITQIGEKKNGGNSYWMLYTTDEEMADTSWGTYEYEGEILGSAILGANVLIVQSGETYIWVYQTF
jgi:hypothetical protein